MCDGSIFFPRCGVEYKQYSFGENYYEDSSTQHISEHANPSFRILFPNARKVTTNGQFVGITLIENIICMKWELRDEKKCEYSRCK